MLAAGSRERAVFDVLMLDRGLRSKFSPDELEDLIVRIVQLYCNEIYYIDANPNGRTSA